MINGLAERLQEQRETAGLTRKQVSSSTGISVSALSNYEHGERTPSFGVLITLARLYHCSADYLLGIEKPPTGKLIDVSMLNDEQYKLLQSCSPLLYIVWGL